MRNTPVRVKVLQALLNSKEALSTADIEQNFQYIDRITLYRTLKTYSDKGIIHQALDGSGNVKYAMCKDTCTEHDHQDFHAHFSCTECQKTFCVDEVNTSSIKAPDGFTVNHADIILKGVCQDCGLN